MVATTDCVEKSKPIPGNKVSKPLMEKKRRARINKCLDQLKSLLESYYSTSIRKRKLEKADILELTVKHLRNLQKIQSSAAALSEFPDYKTGFRSCLANANRYLLMADDLTGSDRWVLSQLSGKLCRSRGLEEGFSTTDSGPGRAGARDEARRLRPPAAGPEEGRTAASGAPGPRSSSPSPSSPSGDGDARRSSGDGRAAAAAVRARSTRGKSCSHKKFGAVSRGDEAANTQHNVWRPW